METSTKIGIGIAALGLMAMLSQYEKDNPKKKSACCGEVKRAFRRNTNYD